MTVATPATDASWELPVKVEALAKSFSRGGTVAYKELPDRWSEGLGELTGHLIGDGCMTDVQTGWVLRRRRHRRRPRRLARGSCSRS